MNKSDKRPPLFLVRAVVRSWKQELVAVGITLFALLAALSLAFASVSPAAAGCQPVITVTSSGDNGAGTVRQAILDICEGGDIYFDLPLPATILLTGSELVVDKGMTIHGPDARLLTIRRELDDRIFNVTGQDVTIAGLTIYGGYAEKGGGIRNSGTLTLSHSTVMKNQVYTGADWGGAYGGGTYNAGNLVIEYSTIAQNSASIDLWCWQCLDGGAGIFNDGSNAALTIRNSTISRNSGMIGDGAGIYNHAGVVSVSHTTIAGNWVSDQLSNGGGIANEGGSFTLGNSILSNNILENCSPYWRPFTSQGYNLDSDGSCELNGPGDLSQTDPLLGPLEDNGGQTDTHALLAGSPAVDAGSCAGATADQRGFPRPVDVPGTPNAVDACDMGAYEAQDVMLALAKQVSYTLPMAGWPITYTIVARNTSVISATGGLISDTLPTGLSFVGPVTLSPPQSQAILAQDASDLPTLASNLIITTGQSITLTFPAIIDLNVAAGTEIINTAAITSTETAIPQHGSVSLQTCTLATVVTNNANLGPGSLRRAITDVCPQGRIDFDFGHPFPVTITLTTGRLLIDKPLTISGPGADRLAISGNNSSRIFRITASGVHLEGLALRHGVVADAGIENADGGAIYSTGALTISHSLLSFNQSGDDGGAIAMGDGDLTIINTIISDNAADDAGGGIYHAAAGAVTILHSRLTNNVAGLALGAAFRSGGAIYNDSTGSLVMEYTTLANNQAASGGSIYHRGGTLRLTHSTLSGNEAVWDGGGIYIFISDNVRISNSTLSGNLAAGNGGGVYNRYGTVRISHSTFYENQDISGEGGGIYNHTDGMVRLDNTIIAHNDGGDCVGAVTSLGHNLDSDGSCDLADPTDLPNEDPLLDSLADNGGATWTHATLAGSPAVDAGICTDQYGNPVTADQRGVSRPQAADCDMGAYEAVPLLAQVDYRFWMSDGDSGAGRYTLLADGSFIDESSQAGDWFFQPSPPRLFLRYDAGFACEALSVGRFAGIDRLAGIRLCRDGSNLNGLWTSNVVIPDAQKASSQRAE